MDTVKHLIARAACLIILPICLYMTFFYIHLTVLNRSLHNASMPQYVAYGAVITLKNHRTGGGYLHSHFHLYPEGVGARQQQITTYTHKDDNNKWIIKKYNEEPNIDKVEIVKNGDLVTGYGENGTGDANDVWRLTIISSAEGSELQACLLTTSGKQLPKWGYEQQEVSCNPNLRDVNGLWNVEENYFEKSLLFSSMITGILIDYLLEELPKFFGEQNAKVVYHTALGLVLSATVYSFYLFAPLTYGMTGPSSHEANSTLYGLKWMDSWEF
nr:unnamed protein product [Callosobruchus analis]